jgi:uncharacterized protein YeaO (DUF488 family)
MLGEKPINRFPMPKDRNKERSTLFKSMIKTKCVWDSMAKQDGLRILTTRFRGRGLPRSRCDVWMANLGPSEKLLSDFQSQKSTWGEFGRRYRKELMQSFSSDKANQRIKNYGQKFTLRLIQVLGKRGPVTLMCHCASNQKQCHTRILKKVLSTKVS